MNQLPTAQQRRILRLMFNDDLIWKVAGKSYRSIYNERLGRQQRIPASTVEEMEQQGWIRRLDNPNSSRLALPSQQRWVNLGLRASIMREQAGSSYMKEVLASNGPVRMP